MAEGGSGQKLTVRDRILVHLSEYPLREGEHQVPLQVAQAGVVEAVGIKLSHLPQYVRPMAAEGLVVERLARVEGARQRRKSYFLTPQGRQEAARLRGNTLSRVVEVEGEGGDRRAMTLSEATKGPFKGTPLLVLVREVEACGYLHSPLAKEALPPGKGTAFYEMLSEAPKLEGFVGRKVELEAITKDGEGPRIFVVTGVAGIGKSCLGAKACEILRGRRNLFWHRIRAWDTPQSVLASLGDFLSALGRPGLRAILTRGEDNRAPQVLREDLPGTKAFLVFDDAHEATREVVVLFGLLKEAIVSAPDVRALILSRRTLPFYDRREVLIGKLVDEMDLGELDSQDVVALLSAEGETGLLNLGGKLGGHPLALQLLRSGPRPPVGPQVLRNLHRFIEEEIFTELSGDERRMMKTAALYRVPVPRDALFPDADLSHDVLFSLRGRSLIRPVGEAAYEVHDTIRDFFLTLLTPSEQGDLGGFAIGRLQDMASKAKREGNFVSCIDCLSNALRISSPGEGQGPLWEALGDAYEKIGDLSGTMTAYREASAKVTQPEVVARLHRKLASALAHRGDIDSASKEIEAGFQALGGKQSVERGWLHLSQCRVAFRRYEFQEAEESGQKAFEIFRALHVPQGEGEALMELGWIKIHSPKGDRALGERHLLSALDLANSLGDPKLASEVHVALAHTYMAHHPDVNRALQHVVAAEELPALAEDPQILLLFLSTRAWITLEQQADYPKAEEFLREAMAQARKIHDAGTLAWMRHNLALSSYFQGRTQEACAEFEELAVARVPGPHRLIGAGPQYYNNLVSLWMTAECALVMGDVEGFQRTAKAFEDQGPFKGLEPYPIHLGVVRGLDSFLKGHWESSQHSFKEAVRVAEDQCASGMALLQGFAYLAPLYYGIALRVMGREREGGEYIDRALKLLRDYHLEARLSVLPAIEREVGETLRIHMKS